MSWLRLFATLSSLYTVENGTAPLGDITSDIMSNSTEANQQYFK